MRARAAGLCFAGSALLVTAAARPSEAAEPPGHTGMLGPYPMDREASGTSWQPEAAGMEGLHLHVGSWRVMVHAWAFGLFTRQGGPRGGDQAFSTNMLMAAGSRTLAGGMLSVRAMASLEPLMGPRGYRLLLQTGETDGRTNLVDRQHPHDMAMELAGAYSRPIGHGRSVFVYAGWPGEPALGPPVFMHRASGDEIPVAPLAHHWLDATHISFGVATLGLVWGPAKLEASAFNGLEPDASRWNFERPRFDSPAARLTLNPRPWLSAQVSLADLRSPERLHPGIDVRRYTASLAYAGTWGRTRASATLAWGRNARSGNLPQVCPLAVHDAEVAFSCAREPPYGPSRVLDAHLAERHTAYLRAERVEKDELFPVSDPFHARVFPVGSVEAGYRWDFLRRRRVWWGLGAAASVSLVPEFLWPDYGRRPRSYWIFAAARVR